MFTAPIPEAILVFVMLELVPDRGADGREDAQLDRHAVARHDRIQDAAAVLRRASSRMFVIGGISGDLPGHVPDRLAAQRNLLRGRPPAFRADGRRGVHDLRGDLLLVPEDHRPDAGRGARAGSASALMFVGILVTFLIQHVIGLDGMPRRVYEYDDVGNLPLYNADLHGRLVHPRRRRARDDRQRRAQPQARRRRRAGPVEGEHARVVHDLAAAGQQLRRRAARALGRNR